MNKKSIKLKVIEALTRDVGRGVARIDYDSMDTLNCETGDIVEIKGKRITVAKCLPLYPSDEDRGIVRIDRLGRDNAGIKIGNTISVKKIKCVPAKKVFLKELEAYTVIDVEYVANVLEGMPLVKGDNVVIPYFGGRLTFQVFRIIPQNVPVMVTMKTIVHLRQKRTTLLRKKRVENINKTNILNTFGPNRKQSHWSLKDIIIFLQAKKIGFNQLPKEVQERLLEYFLHNYKFSKKGLK